MHLIDVLCSWESLGTSVCVGPPTVLVDLCLLGPPGDFLDGHSLDMKYSETPQPGLHHALGMNWGEAVRLFQPQGF